MKKFGLYKKMRRVATAPIILLVIAITVCSYVRFSNTMYDEARNNMRTLSRIILSAYDSNYPGDYELKQTDGGKYDLYKGDAMITEDYSIIDDINASSETEISILYMDMRIHTTLKSDSGMRLAGMCTNADTAEKVLKEGREMFYKDIDINGGKYLVLYVPIVNSDGTIIGMVETARKMGELKKSVLVAMWPILVIAIIGMTIALFITYKSVLEITGVLSKLQKFITGVAGGDLQTEVDSKISKREDELGEITRASVRMQRSIRNFVETDPVTGLGNRRYVNGLVSKLSARQKETGVPYAIAISDIDFFKKVNDTYGHNAGDEVLKAVAGELKEGMKGHGIAARWGGEEFILIFEKCTSREAYEIAEKILERIRKMTVSTEGYNIKVTMTFGIADPNGRDFEKVVEAADEKLYYGKTHGRNRVVLDIQESDGKESNEENKK